MAEIAVKLLLDFWKYSVLFVRGMLSLQTLQSYIWFDSNNNFLSNLFYVVANRREKHPFLSLKIEKTFHSRSKKEVPIFAFSSAFYSCFHLFLCMQLHLQGSQFQINLEDSTPHMPNIKLYLCTDNTKHCVELLMLWELSK